MSERSDLLKEERKYLIKNMEDFIHGGDRLLETFELKEKDGPWKCTGDVWYCPTISGKAPYFTVYKENEDGNTTSVKLYIGKFYTSFVAYPCGTKGVFPKDSNMMGIPKRNMKMTTKANLIDFILQYLNGKLTLKDLCY